MQNVTRLILAHKLSVEGNFLAASDKGRQKMAERNRWQRNPKLLYLFCVLQRLRTPAKLSEQLHSIELLMTIAKIIQISLPGRLQKGFCESIGCTLAEDIFLCETKEPNADSSAEQFRPKHSFSVWLSLLPYLLTVHIRVVSLECIEQN